MSTRPAWRRFCAAAGRASCHDERPATDPFPDDASAADVATWSIDRVMDYMENESLPKSIKAIRATKEMADKHPELVVTFMKGMIKVGRWGNQNKYAAATILDKQTFYLDVDHTYRGIKNLDLVPNLSPQNLVAVEIGKDFLLSHGYIKNDFDVHEWAAPEFLELAAKELIEERWKLQTEAKLPAMTTTRLG